MLVLDLCPELRDRHPGQEFQESDRLFVISPMLFLTSRQREVAFQKQRQLECVGGQYLKLMAEHRKLPPVARLE